VIVVRSCGGDSRPAVLKPRAAWNGGEASALPLLPAQAKGEPRSTSFCPASVNAPPEWQDVSPTSANPRVKSTWRAPISVKLSPMAVEVSLELARAAAIFAKSTVKSVEGSPSAEKVSRTEARNRSFDAARRDRTKDF
jgi:hypothetical protein